MDRESKRALIGVGIIGAIIGGLCLQVWYGSDTRTPASPSQPSESPKPKATNRGEEAYYLARKVCEKSLKAPATAKFSNPNLDANTGWEPYGYFQWKAFGYVDAQNSFGAMLRNQWLAVVQFNTGRLEVVYFRLNDQETDKMPSIRKAPGT
jgi:hypothetical protein